jgi:23S rRNA (guanosine2251-2'-O)-methyltransferase
VSRRLVYGTGPVKELLASGASSLECLFVSERRQSKPQVAAIVSQAKGRGLTPNIAPPEDLDQLVGHTQHQGVVAVVGAFEYADLFDVIRAARSPGLFVALDSVVDPRNLGAIIRSALLLGCDALLLPKDRSARVNATVTKVSAGATEHLPIVQVTNLVRALEELREAGYWRAALAAGEGAMPPNELDASLPLVLVLGAEGSGLRPRVAKHCDFRVEIPMHHGRVGSYNVSVAAAIALYDIARRRGFSASSDSDF